MKKILVTGDFDIPERLLSENVLHLRTPQDNEDIATHLNGISHYIVGGPEYVDEALMACAPNLKHIVVMGTGTVSFVDLKSAFARGIQVDNTPGINANAVAEFALGSIIFNLANSFHSQEGLLRGAWYQKSHRTLSDINVGIVGLGDIGSRLAAKIKAISPSTNVSYFSRNRKDDAEKKYDVKYKTLDKLTKESDVVVMCLTYNEQSHYIINANSLRDAKKGIVIFNFSNPKTIDPAALKDALISGQVGFAFYDGYYDEWINNKGRDNDKYGLLNLGSDKFVATSHIAAQADGVILDILDAAFSKIEKWNAIPVGQNPKFLPWL